MYRLLTCGNATALACLTPGITTAPTPNWSVLNKGQAATVRESARRPIAGRRGRGRNFPGYRAVGAYLCRSTPC